MHIEGQQGLGTYQKVQFGQKEQGTTKVRIELLTVLIRHVLLGHQTHRSILLKRLYMQHQGELQWLGHQKNSKDLPF